MPQIREAKTFLPLTEYSSAKDHKYTLRMTCGEKKWEDKKKELCKWSQIGEKGIVLQPAKKGVTSPSSLIQFKMLQ